MLGSLGCPEAVLDSLAVVGLVVAARCVLYLVLDVVEALRKFVWARQCDENLALKYGGKWAVVTGCTAGIGKEYARQLAGRGMNILLISRNIDKLNNVQKLIKEESPGVETEIVQVDFSHGRVIYPKIASHMSDKDVGILVNNVASILIPPKKFIDASEDDVWNHVNNNVGSVVAMTQLVLAKMLARRSGAIINVASIVSSHPLPYWGIYTASKAFVDFFSESLSWECRGSGITVQTLRPGTVLTAMIDHIQGFTESTAWIPSPSTYVSSALPTLGQSGRTTGYWRHGLQNFIMENIYSRKMFMAGVEKFMKANEDKNLKKE